MQSYENLFDYARYDEIVAIENKNYYSSNSYYSDYSDYKSNRSYNNYSNYKKVETQYIASLPFEI